MRIELSNIITDPEFELCIYISRVKSSKLAAIGRWRLVCEYLEKYRYKYLYLLTKYPHNPFNVYEFVANNNIMLMSLAIMLNDDYLFTLALDFSTKNGMILNYNSGSIYVSHPTTNDAKNFCHVLGKYGTVWHYHTIKELVPKDIIGFNIFRSAVQYCNMSLIKAIVKDKLDYRWYDEFEYIAKHNRLDFLINVKKMFKKVPDDIEVVIIAAEHGRIAMVEWLIEENDILQLHHLNKRLAKVGKRIEWVITDV